MITLPLLSRSRRSLSSAPTWDRHAERMARPGARFHHARAHGSPVALDRGCSSSQRHRCVPLSHVSFLRISILGYSTPPSRAPCSRILRMVRTLSSSDSGLVLKDGRRISSIGSRNGYVRPIPVIILLVRRLLQFCNTTNNLSQLAQSPPVRLFHLDICPRTWPTADC